MGSNDLANVCFGSSASISPDWHPVVGLIATEARTVDTPVMVIAATTPNVGWLWLQDCLPTVGWL